MRPARVRKKALRIRGIVLRTSVRSAAAPLECYWADLAHISAYTQQKTQEQHTPHLQCCGCFSSSYEHCTIHLSILKLHYTATRVLALTDMEFFLGSVVASTGRRDRKKRNAQVRNAAPSLDAVLVPIYIISLIS